MNSAKRFTLLELLTVTIIIAILAALLLPALMRARYDARRAVCINQMKQQSAAILTYAGDHDLNYPGFGAVYYDLLPDRPPFFAMGRLWSNKWGYHASNSSKPDPPYPTIERILNPYVGGKDRLAELSMCPGAEPAYVHFKKNLMTEGIRPYHHLYNWNGRGIVVHLGSTYGHYASQMDPDRTKEINYNWYQSVKRLMMTRVGSRCNIRIQRPSGTPAKRTRILLMDQISVMLNGDHKLYGLNANHIPPSVPKYFNKFPNEYTNWTFYTSQILDVNFGMDDGSVIAHKFSYDWNYTDKTKNRMYRTWSSENGNTFMFPKEFLEDQ